MTHPDADFTRTVRAMRDDWDRVPTQREASDLPAVVWVDPRRRSGEPCIYGTRLTTRQVARMVEDYGIEYVREGWPHLTDEQIEGACWFERTHGRARVGGE